MGGHEVVFAESEEDVSLSDSTVANDEDFSEIVVADVPSHSIYLSNNIKL